ncbi:MAG: hypothetical protein WBK08_04665, partial [Nitrospira sp.]
RNDGTLVHSGVSFGCFVVSRSQINQIRRVFSNPQTPDLVITLANEIQTNAHCLLPDFETTKQLIETGMFNNSEPGPYRIFAVYTLE